MRAITIQDMVITAPEGYGMGYNEKKHRFCIMRSAGDLGEVLECSSDTLEKIAQRGYDEATFCVEGNQIFFSAVRKVDNMRSDWVVMEQDRDVSIYD